MPFKPFAGLVAVSLFAAVVAQAAEEIREVRLYALDCGHAHFQDLGAFSDTGEYDGKPGDLAMPCFLIRHPKGTLLWDTGLGDKLAESKAGVDNGGVHMSVPVTLGEQLKALSLAPSDVSYLAFSHFHFDHTGNAGRFDASTWIVNRAELAYAQQTPVPFGIDASIAGLVRNARTTRMIDGDEDVFGDGSVRILKAPGHTAGHQVLEIKLKKSGVVILSGDLYHTRDNRKFRRVPAFNYERADTLASIDRIEAIVRNTHARLVVQHDPVDFRSLPKFPAFLD
jgi:glyoxylase-like metal-dependent hydrolase (beta-lactamase superfamily II)